MTTMIRNGTFRAAAIGLISLILVLGFASGAAAQAASSATYFLPGAELGSGGVCTSTTFRLEASFGSGVVAARADGTSTRLLGGFNAAIEAPALGRPWLTGVRPLHGPLLGSSARFTVHGTELDLGTTTNVTIGGRAATVLSRAQDHVVVTLPAQSAPGWQPVTATNSGGTAVLPKGVGVLPMVEKPHAIEIGRPFRVTYRGTPGDIVFLAVASAKFPFTISVPPYHHGLELNIGALLGPVVGPFPVTNPSGEFHLDFPGFSFVRPIYVQMLGLPTANPGYAPGSFTNVIGL
jgi:hypothetical protein